MWAWTPRRVLFVPLVVALMMLGLSIPTYAEADGVLGAEPLLYAPPFSLSFPLEGSHGFSDTFGAIRDGGSRLHQGNDISAPKTTPVLAAASGVISRIDVGEKAGLYVEIQHAEGWHTRYLHLNNDEPPPPPVVEPVCEVVSIEDGAADDVTTDDPVADDPVADDPVVEDVTADDPVADDPVADDPVADDPVADDPVVDDPVVDDPAVEDVTADDAVVDDPAVEDVVTDDTAADEVICTEAPVVEEPLTWGIPPEVFVGAAVAVGDVIGFVGTSGNASSTAPHLHFEVRMPDGTPVNPYPILTGETSPRTLYVLPDVTDDPVTVSIDVIGHADPTGGFNADVWVHRGVAYLSTLGRGESCPATGVRRYDVTDPSEPVELEAISGDYPGTSTEAVWAGQVDTDRFSGDLAVVAHQLCDPDDEGAFRGLVLYDVTDPLLPVQLGTYETGAGTLGAHDFDVWVDDARVLLLAAVPNSFLDHPDALGDVRIVDITDPANPLAVADWDFRRDAVGGDADPWGFSLDDQVVLSGVDPDDADPREFRAQGVTIDPDGKRAFVAFGDAGVVVLDLSDPSQPEAGGRITSPGYRDGESYSTAFGSDSGILVVNDRDLDPLGDADDDEAETGSWGISVVFDETDQDDLSLASGYSIEDALPDVEGRLALDGMYTAHEAVVTGDYLFAVWLSGGLRVVDLSDPTEPVEVASFLPPTRVDPQRYFASPNGNIAMPLAWSVHVVDNLIYVSDANTGLWILRLTEPPIGTD